MRETYIKMQDVLRLIDHYGNNTLLRDMILSLNPANVAPIRRGHWIRGNGNIECSVCGECVRLTDRTREEAAIENTYCRACGAEMEDR